MKYWSIAIITIVFFGCQDIKHPEKPKNLIPQDKMVDVLTEAYLANAARSVNNKPIINEGLRIDSLVYDKFGVDSLQFANSNAYYAADINMYMKIFQDVETRLSKMEKKHDSIQKTITKLNDSVNRKTSK